MQKMIATKKLEMNKSQMNKNLIIFNRALMGINSYVKEFIFKI